MNEPAYHLFERFGVELEYMIVDRDGLGVQPLTDQVLKAVAGTYTSDVEFGPFGWSNELVLHVIEIKTLDPVPSLTGLGVKLQEHVGRINDLLAPMGARLMPSGAHPWMNPAERKLWPHESSVIYETFDRIFDCRGHGWANLQAIHLNLPFAGADEFGRLHAALRLLVPLLPALTASTPFLNGAATGLLDNRVAAYRENCARIPSITGSVVPEPLFTPAAYDKLLLRRLYRDIAPHDPQNVLQEEWLNARGVIARFERNAIEIRLMDMQECPVADVAVCAAVAGVARALVKETWCERDVQEAVPTTLLKKVLLQTTDAAELAKLNDHRFLDLFGYPGPRPCTASELWSHLVAAARIPDEASARCLDVILSQGTLARRLLKAVGSEPSRDRLHAVYCRLCDALANGEMFTDDV